MAIKGYHNENGIFNTSDFMEKLLKTQQNIRFSGAGTSHQNGAVDCTINMVVNMTRTMFMHTMMRCPKDTLSTDFGQRKCNIFYGSTVRYLIYGMVYKLLGKFEPYISWSQGCISLK